MGRRPLDQSWPPQYVAIDRKPENGCEIQNAACGRSGVMLRLKLVKGVNLPGSEDEVLGDNEESLLHGTNVLKHVVSPWFGTNRIVCADSYFASVGAAKELYRNGLRFIGVVKTATRGYPKTFLTSVELQNRGDFLALRSNATEDSPNWGNGVDGSGASVLYFHCRVFRSWSSVRTLPMEAS
ncbi:Transposase IS4 [Fragilaria crotonensis]|nr:Transposase IS4 [Fragilaria crotonensis]